jgi:hypothetical protein
VYHACLLPHRDQLRLFGDRLGTRVQIALTARGQLDSGPPPGLKHSEGGCPEGHEQKDSPPPGRTGPDNERCKADRDSEHYKTECHPLTAL